MKRYLKPAICVLGWIAVGFFVPAAAMADDAPLEPLATVSVGGAYIVGQNAAEARDRAVAVALASALNQVLAARVPPEDLARDFEWVSGRFYDQAQEFIQGYQVLAEGQSDGFYRVLLSVTIPEVSVVKALSEKGMAPPAESEKETKTPRVLLCVAERIGRDTPYHYWWSGGQIEEGTGASAIVGALSRQGFALVAPGGPLPESMRASLQEKPELGDAEAAELGRQLAADVVVVGTVTTDAPRIAAAGSVATIQATLRVRAVETASGQSLFKVEESGVTVDADPLAGAHKALVQVGEAGGERLAGGLSDTWELPAGSTDTSQTSLTMELTDIGQFSDFLKFRKLLGEVSGVGTVEIRRVEGNRAELAVTFEGGSAQLADELLSRAASVLHLTVRSVSENALVLSLAPE